jgi:alkanesulfonate monooxygenase SsuD/methylene tetrahydromethanopterin reductase-like flavin-dependent oxidoreductase (luciferase family)
VCDAVEGLFLNEPSIAALNAAATKAESDGLDVLFVSEGPLGDPVTLAAALSAVTSRILLGVRTTLQAHPTMVAREMTTLDHVSGGRAVLAFAAPFSAATSAAVAICRAMFRDGTAISEGPHFLVPGAVNLPGPISPDGPPIALDATGIDVPSTSLVALCDLVLVPAGTPPSAALPAGVRVCQIHNA